MVGVDSCPRCSQVAKLSVWPFSDQALAALVVWGELDKKAVGSAICHDCYDELREVLIDRQEEISNPKPPAKIEVVKPKVSKAKKAAKKKPAAKKKTASKKKKTAAASKVKKKISKVSGKKTAAKKKAKKKKSSSRKAS